MEKIFKLNKKVLITGASRGIGRATAIQLAEEGYDLLLHASKLENLNELLSSLPQDCKYELLIADFSAEEQVKEFISRLKKEHKKLFGIVSNAGIAIDKALAYQPISEIDKMLNVNLKAPVLLAKTAMKLFSTEKKGVFIAISSCVGEMGNAFQSVYAASKAGNVALCKSLAKEIGLLYDEHQIRFISLSPGFIQTDMVNALNKEIQIEYLKKVPLKRAGEAKEVANTVSFLLSDKASYINGSEIKINGGLL